MVKLFKLENVNGLVKVTMTSAMKAVLILEVLFAAFLFETGYTFLGIATFGFYVVGFLFFVGGIGVVFIAVLPFMPSFTGILGELQSQLIKQENQLTPEELAQLKALLPILENLLKAEGENLGNSLVEKKE